MFKSTKIPASNLRAGDIVRFDQLDDHSRLPTLVSTIAVIEDIEESFYERDDLTFTINPLLGLDYLDEITRHEDDSVDLVGFMDPNAAYHLPEQYKTETGN